MLYQFACSKMHVLLHYIYTEKKRELPSMFIRLSWTGEHIPLRKFHIYVVLMYRECYYLGGPTSKSTLYSVPLILMTTYICWRCVSRPKNKNVLK